MICILSQSYLESTTEAVIDWLRSWDVPVVRLNSDDITNCNGSIQFSVGKSGVKFRIVIDNGKTTLDSTSVSVVWYRRWPSKVIPDRPLFFAEQGPQGNANAVRAAIHLCQEASVVNRLFFEALDSAAWVSYPQADGPNKLDVLRLASATGMEIPDTLVTTNLQDVRTFMAKHGKIITKPLGEMLHFVVNNRNFATYTSVVPEELIGEGGWSGGFPCLFQELLDKKYEIRVFYLDGQCHSMAMFSQSHSATQVDFRRYPEDPTRVVPYNLPEGIEQLIDTLMKRLNLDTGSLDMVRTKDGRFVLLEVNPAGQFGMVSYPCNYFLEKRMASRLRELYLDRRSMPENHF